MLQEWPAYIYVGHSSGQADSINHMHTPSMPPEYIVVTMSDQADSHKIYAARQCASLHIWAGPLQVVQLTP